MFAILKQLASEEIEIMGEGVVEVLQDGFGFLRSPEANYGPAPTISTSRPPRSDASACAPVTLSRVRSAARKEGERHFALLKVNTINFDKTEKARHKMNFDITLLYPGRSGCAWSTTIQPRRICRRASSRSRTSGKASAR